jgi:hypothetical protein
MLFLPSAFCQRKFRSQNKVRALTTMKRSFLTLAVLASLTLAGCGSNSDNSGTPGVDDSPGQKAARNRVNWAAVPADFNPQIENSDLNIEGTDEIKLDLFYHDDVTVEYSANLAPDQGHLQIFKVYKESASWAGLSQNTNGSSLRVSNQGSYSCQIQIENGNITALKGGCYVRVILTLPAGSQVEVYNGSDLISKRFKAMSNASFISQIDQATWEKDRTAVIDAYLSSYAAVQRSPSLSATELGQVLHKCSFDDEKLEVLRRLHQSVADRSSLSKMIDDEFAFFKRNEARAIVGLPQQNH